MLRSLRSRLITSHALVAVVATCVTFVAVRLVAPAVLSRHGHGTGAGRRGPGEKASARQQLLDTVTTSLLLGTVLALGIAVTLGWWLAVRLSRSVESSAATARAMADGDWSVRLVPPREKELADLAAAVNELGERLGRTEAARVELLRDVAHEMRTPISVVRADIEGMLDGVLERDDAELTGVHYQVMRLQRLTEDLSALSRSDEAPATLRLEEADLSEVGLTVAETFRSRATEKGIELEVGAAVAAPVQLDPDRVGQVVANLMSNALRATPRGGRVSVSVSVEERSGLLTGTGKQGNRASRPSKPGGIARVAVLRVEDTGRGLRSEELSRAFERFWRGPADRAQEGSGTGIGLSIARGIARAHGGDLILSSPGPGRGCVAELILPQGEVAQEQP
ncbi:Signal transduction histidine-protein kinase BaeS [Actinomyces bovis]|uniref:histidine kinase n=1 Tax=Actinomyces bovis TaxID=1658 RepID=A0ABY1VMR6_9ACTO|nr:HAMP domain-containing sensor histidine kinase [Actinomyces bovis]SPT53401.1 Signal transduction histidine-protein kinase BaeS [Actinomyces bovis]VEG52819.1 Signal transduction histidine-protein kinase BaeS [Actinomyces israelii]